MFNEDDQRRKSLNLSINTNNIFTSPVKVATESLTPDRNKLIRRNLHFGKII
jgi:hypothetical protein